MIARHPHPRSAGFTLVETLVVLVLTGIVVAGLYQMLYAGRRSHDIKQHQIEMQQNARVAIGSLADDFRHVSYGKDPTQPSIDFAGPDSIVYVADVMTEVPGAEKISYYLDPNGDPDTSNPDDTILMKSVSDSSGAVLFTQPQSYGIARDGLALAYYNGGGDPLPNPVPQPELIGEMQIEVTATERERWKQQPYSTMSLSATVYPRNLPLSPARSRPSVPECGEPTYPNCSSATLTWETPTTNTDGTELLLSDISHFNIYFGVDPENLPLHARLARTLTEFTISDVGCDTYIAAITCVSRSGVESYQCRRTVVITGNRIPKAPESVTTADSSGVIVRWAPVTRFDDDTQITVPVDYEVHRSQTSGFAPDGTTLIATVVDGATEYHDPLPEDCAEYFYKVRADVCCKLSDPSPEADAYRPSPPQCPTALAGVAGAQEGTLELSWTHPASRGDYTPLPLGDILETWVYYDTIPGAATQYAVIPAPANSTTLTGLVGCNVYYVHARTRDVCGHLSDNTCLGNEITVPLADPCDPVVPTGPAWLTLTGADVIEVAWPANNTDCDLQGYRIYYGYEPGTYNGTGAAEGDSPISVSVIDVTEGGQCRSRLSGLAECKTLYVAVAAFDSCEPAHVSAFSPEQNILTACAPCLMAGGCASWITPVAGEYRDMHLEIYTTGNVDETYATILPKWEGDAKLLQVLYGRPLAQIWNSDGTAGGDGYVGPQGPGTMLNVDDFIVPSWSSLDDGMPIAFIFNTDVRDIPTSLEFHNVRGGICTVDGTPRAAAVFDDFDDGTINDWIVRSGTWAADSGELYQSANTQNRMLVGNKDFSTLTMESKIKITSGTIAYLVFRYVDDSNFDIVGIRSDTDVVRLGHYRGNVFTELNKVSTPIDANRWYNLKVSANGSNIEVWLDCVHVMSFVDLLMPENGKVGFRTASTAARWDDVRCRNVAELP